MNEVRWLQNKNGKRENSTGVKVLADGCIHIQVMRRAEIGIEALYR